MKHKIRIGFLIVVFILLSVLFIFYYRNVSITDYTREFAVEKVSSDTAMIRVGTYNIKSLNMGEGLEAFKEEMKVLPLDVICLQEVDQNASRSQNMDIVQEMTSAAGYSYAYFFPSMWMADGYYGLGILSRYPIAKVSSIRLPHTVTEEPRIFVQADIVVDDRTLHVYNTHVTYKDRDLRRQQIAFIKERLQNQSDTILMGDFNIFSDQDFFTIDGMTAVNLPAQRFITFRDFGFPDNIFVSDDLQAVHPHAQPSGFSDHHLLYCDILLKF